jgi:hypothetical protein
MIGDGRHGRARNSQSVTSSSINRETLERVEHQAGRAIAPAVPQLQTHLPTGVMQIRSSATGGRA